MEYLCEFRSLLISFASVISHQFFLVLCRKEKERKGKIYHSKDLTESISETNLVIPFKISSTTTPSLNFAITKCLKSPIATSCCTPEQKVRHQSPAYIDIKCNIICMSTSTVPIYLYLSSVTPHAPFHLSCWQQPSNQSTKEPRHSFPRQYLQNNICKKVQPHGAINPLVHQTPLLHCPA